MVDVVALAEAVAAEIDGAEVDLAPEFSLKDLKGRTRTVVVPAGIRHRMLARGMREDLLTVQVGVLRKATEDELEALVGEVQRLALRFLHRTVAGAKCVEAGHAPLYVPDHMRERRQFTGVVELLFKEVSPHEVEG